MQKILESNNLTIKRVLTDRKQLYSKLWPIFPTTIKEHVWARPCLDLYKEFRVCVMGVGVVFWKLIFHSQNCARENWYVWRNKISNSLEVDIVIVVWRIVGYSHLLNQAGIGFKITCSGYYTIFHIGTLAFYCF